MKPNTVENTKIDESIRANNELREMVLKASDLFWENYFPDSATDSPPPPSLSWRLEPRHGGVWATVSEKDDLGERSSPHFFSQEDLFDKRARTIGTLQMLSEVLAYRSRQRKPVIDALIRAMEEGNALQQAD